MNTRSDVAVLEVLEIARERVASHWGRGAFVCEGRYCMMGACGIRSGEHDEFPATQEALRVLNTFVPLGAQPWSGARATPMAEFNDNPDTYLEAVLQCFDQAIAHTRLRVEYNAMS